MERKELLRFDQHEYDYQIKRCEAFCDTLNKIYINLCADYPEDSIKANIADIQSCVTDRSINEEKLKEVLIKILISLNPSVNGLQVSEDVKRNLLHVENLSIEKYLTIPRQNIYQHMFNQRQPLVSTKYISWYHKASKFVVSEKMRDKLKEKYSTFVEGEDLKIWDAVQNVKQAVLELEKVGRVDWSQINLKGCGFQTKTMNEYNFIPYQK